MKLLLVGVWASIVTLGAAFGMLHWQKGSGGPRAGDGEAKVEEYRTKAINVPIIGAGTIQGYIVAQFVFTVDATALAKVPVNPEVYVLDEAFKTIYAGEQVNFQNMKKQDLPVLAKRLGENVNKRLGVEVVRDVLIDQLSYIPKKDMRGGERS
ncbi:hypothetical protein [Hyphomicrobium sp. CS1GBMeth3]|uniref:hypothetical protein n=1 Tax=Hyphomicrobium sp. CS1GBMeth3 TaxID=1892845 RepID=UPI0009F8DFFA|nr:hypothetical protein [Hyphomicrobium sp. CS1GBMeth3]